MPERKLALLDRALGHLVNAKTVYTNDVRCILGVRIWGALLRWDLLCIPEQAAIDLAFCEARALGNATGLTSYVR